MPRSLLPLLLALAALLGSCATYVPPKAGSTATITFIGAHRYAYVDEGNSCESRHLVGEQYWPSTPVRAGQRLWIEQGVDTRGTPYGSWCGLALSFEPEEGVAYVCEYTREGGRCSVLLYRLTLLGQKVREPTLRNERQKRC